MAEVSDIRIFRYGAWRSLRNQKVFDGSAWRQFAVGSGIFHNGEWHTLSEEVTAVSVIVSPSLIDDRWYLTISTTPDVLSTGISEASVSGTIMFSDTSVVMIDNVPVDENQRVDTGVPYVEGIYMQDATMGAVLSNNNYYVSEVNFTGMYNL